MDKHSNIYIIYLVAGCIILTSCTKHKEVIETPLPSPTPVVQATPLATPRSKPVDLPTPSPSPSPSPTPTPSPTPKRTEVTGEEIIAEASKYIGERETRGNNRSPFIDKINLAAGSYLGAPYCATFISYVLASLNVDAPNTAWSPSMVARNNVSWANTQQGDVAGLYFPSKGRVAHVLFIDNREYTKTQITTVEANTSPSGSLNAADRDGDGVYRKIRNKSLMSNSKNKFSRYLDIKKN